MARILMDTFIINSKAISTCQDWIKRKTQDEDDRQAAYAGLDGMARQNLARVAILLDGRTVTCRLPSGFPETEWAEKLRWGSAVTGIPNLGSSNPDYLLAPRRRTNYMRLFDSVTPLPNPNATLYWDVRMVDANARPLVEVEVLDYPPVTSRIGRIIGGLIG